MYKLLSCVGSLAIATGCAPERRAREFPYTGGIVTGGDPFQGESGGSDTSDGTDEHGESEGAASESGDELDGTLAAGIALGRIELDQGVAIIVSEGDGVIPPVARNGELVHGRTTLVQAEWLADGGEARMIEARLELIHADGRIELLVDQKYVAGLADLSDPERSFAWELAPEQVDPGLRMRLSLFEVDDVQRVGATDRAMFPSDGSELELGVGADAMSMRLVLVPVMTPDGGPTLGPAEVTAIRERMLATYPLQDIDLVVGAPWDRDSRLQLIDESFDYMATRRVADGEGSGTYYHLILDNLTCCEEGSDYDSWAGVANIVGGEYADSPRDGISKVYPENADPEWDLATIVHEVGHNHGRSHAPCGDPAGPDPAYPYAGATLTTRGFDIVRGTVIDPQAIAPEFTMPPTDFMSYCWPQWWSDYSWRALVERVRMVTALAGHAEAEPRWRLRGYVREGGVVTWSRVRVLGLPITNDGHGSLEVRARSGAVQTLPVRASEIGDAGVRMVEVELAPALEIEALELRLADGFVHRGRPGAIALAQ